MEESYFDRHGNIIDYYRIFNIPRDADLEQIKSAFRGLIKKYHPDTSPSNYEHITEKIDIIIRGYRVLCDEDARIRYDRVLHSNAKTGPDGIPIIPKKRIRPSTLLSEMLRAQMLPKGVRRRDIIANFGQDIEIFITPDEARSGALAYIELPTKMLCPLCMGRDAHCYVCRGIGRINSNSQIEVRIPPHVDDSTVIDVDLMHMAPDKHTSFCFKNIRIKISIAEGASRE